MGKGPSKYALEIRAETKRRKAEAAEQAELDAAQHRRELARRAQVAAQLGIARPRPTKFAVAANGTRLNRTQYPLADRGLPLDVEFQAKVHLATHPQMSLSATPNEIWSARQQGWAGAGQVGVSPKIGAELFGIAREMVDPSTDGVPTALPEACPLDGLLMASLADSEAHAQLDALMARAQNGTWKGNREGAVFDRDGERPNENGTRLWVRPDTADLAHEIANQADTSIAEVIKFGLTLAGQRVKNGERLREAGQGSGGLSRYLYSRKPAAQLAT